MIRTVLGWLLVLIIIIWVFSNPAAAGHDIKTWIDNTITFAHSIGGH
jgi:hypothetical protein